MKDEWSRGVVVLAVESDAGNKVVPRGSRQVVTGPRGECAQSASSKTNGWLSCKTPGVRLLFWCRRATTAVLSKNERTPSYRGAHAPRQQRAVMGSDPQRLSDCARAVAEFAGLTPSARHTVEADAGIILCRCLCCYCCCCRRTKARYGIVSQGTLLRCASTRGVVRRHDAE
jgi:hypothetical protein